MMHEGFDILGVEDSLADQYITLRVRRIDRDKLAQKIGGGAVGKAAKAAIAFADHAPKATLDLAVPFARAEARKYGVDVDVVVSNVPPSQGGRALSEFFPGVVMGFVGGFSVLAIGKGIAWLFGRR